jgi:hypothetical protein
MINYLIGLSEQWGVQSLIFQLNNIIIFQLIAHYKLGNVHQNIYFHKFYK